MQAPLIRGEPNVIEKCAPYNRYFHQRASCSFALLLAQTHHQHFDRRHQIRFLPHTSPQAISQKLAPHCMASLKALIESCSALNRIGLAQRSSPLPQLLEHHSKAKTLNPTAKLNCVLRSRFSCCELPHAGRASIRKTHLANQWNFHRDKQVHFFDSQKYFRASFQRRHDVKT